MTNETQTAYPSDNVFALEGQSYVEWSAIIAGIMLASAISIVLLAFGSAIGLSFSTAAVSAKSYAIGAGIGAALWFIWVQVSSFMAGSYLTGRMRKRRHDATEHEVEVRDGSHGILVWAGAIVVGSLLALSGASSVITSVGNIAKTATEAASNAAGNIQSGPMQYYTDMLLRAPADATTTVPRADKSAASQEINTILTRSALVAPSTDDQTYLSQLVAQETGVSADIAKSRVDDVYAKIDSVKADAAAAAENARRVGILAAFLLAASLLVSAAASYWAATVGGSHRDEGAVFSGFFKRV